MRFVIAAFSIVVMGGGCSLVILGAKMFILVVSGK